MAVISALFNNKTYSFEQAFNVKDITTSEMHEAIKDCLNLYFSAEKSPREDDCQRLPVVIVNKLTKTMFSEYSASGKNDFETALLTALDKIKRKATQYMLIGGECLLKPVPSIDGFYFVPIRRDCFCPLARDENGNLTSVGTAEFTTVGGKYFTLFERRTSGAVLTIENRLYMSHDKSTVGTQVPLNTLEKYKNLMPFATLPIKGLGLVSLRTPLFNTVDGSADAVAVYAPAAKLIHNIYINEQQIDTEFEQGKSRIIASADMFRVEADEEGHVTKIISDTVFTQLEDDPEEVGITIFSPELREQSYFNRENKYLRNCETLIGLKRGLLSEVEAVERTAKEITSSEGDYNLTILEFQSVWKEAVKEMVSLCGQLGKIYKVSGVTDTNAEKLAIDFGNGVLYDRDKEWSEYMQMVSAGLIKPELAVAWRFKLACKTEEDIESIRKNYMPQIEELTKGEE